MPLNDRQIKLSKPKEKAYKLNDAHGLYLHVTPAGSKTFRLDFALNGKRSTLTIGKYPAVSLNEARIAAENARMQIANGINPAKKKQEVKQAIIAAQQNTFQNIAREWYEKQLNRWKPNHAARVWRTLELDVFPYIGKIQIDLIAVRDVKAVIERIVERGALEAANQIRQRIHAIFNYAALLELVTGNPAAPLQGIYQSPPSVHMAALPREELTEFYRRLCEADIEPQNKIAVLLLVLVFVRNNELRGGKWQEIDFQAVIWTIPPERMKRPRKHTIPLSTWALSLLKELHTLTGHTDYLFPSRVKDGYISENTLGKIMNNLGYKGIATPHGFRSLASSTLNEQGYNADAIERQLAHVESNAIKAAYNRADYWNERVEMMQWYSDLLHQHYQAAKEAA